MKQPQPGMPILDDRWREWFKRHITTAMLDNAKALDAMYKAGYDHGLSVGVEQGILSGAPTPDDEKGFLQPNSAEQQAKVDALGEQIWRHNFGPDAKRRP